MKIESDLRIAIKAKERAQPQKSWEERHKREREAIAVFVARPRHSAKIKKALSVLKNTDLKRKAACKVLYDIGLNSQCDGISDRDKFEVAGGVYPRRHENWKADEIISKIAMAETQNQVDAILKSIGINWK